jgi:phosphoribosylformylglycinamidine (FGAM) synthase-like enzyme
MTPAQYQEMEASQFAEPEDYGAALKQILGSPNMASRRWVWEQYDTLIQGNSLQLPGGDAGVVRVEGHETKALAFSSDVTPRYCEADPFEGGKQAVAECWRNITATGAEPLAATDNLNFGNPQRPEIMGQLVRAIEGIGEACTALGFPIVSGNVSLYNETNGEGDPADADHRRRRPCCRTIRSWRASRRCRTATRSSCSAATARISASRSSIASSTSARTARRRRSISIARSAMAISSARRSATAR